MIDTATMMLFGRPVTVILDPSLPARDIRFLPPARFLFTMLPPDPRPKQSAVAKSIERHRRKLLTSPIPRKIKVEE